MSQRRPSGNDTVQIRLDMRALLIGGGLLAAVLIFGLAFAIGRLASGSPAAAPAAPAAAVAANPGQAQSQAPAPAQQQPQAQAQQPNPGRDSAPVPVAAGRAPVGAEAPIGDNPRLALPELKTTNYIYDFGEISPTQKVEKDIVIKNDGAKPLEIKDVKST